MAQYEIRIVFSQDDKDRLLPTLFALADLMEDEFNSYDSIGLGPVAEDIKWWNDSAKFEDSLPVKRPSTEN